MTEEKSPEHPDSENQGNDQSKDIPAKDQQISAPVVDPITITPKHQIYTDSEIDKGNGNTQEQKQLKWIKFEAISTVILNFLTLIVIGVGAWIAYGQMEITRGQLREMRDSTGLTMMQVESVFKQNQNTEKLASAALDQATAAIDQVKELRASAKIAEATLRTAERGLESSYESFRVTTRPYVVATGVEVKEFVPEKPLSVQVRVRNTGQTPGVDLTLRGRVHYGPKPLPAVIDEGTLEILDPSISIIGSNLPQAAPVVSKAPVNKVIFEAVQSNTIGLFVEGIIKYKDIFTIAPGQLPTSIYETRYCYRYSPATKTMNFCGVNNWIK